MRATTVKTLKRALWLHARPCNNHKKNSVIPLNTLAMKPSTTIRVLAGLSLLIFFCPFFQMCSDENIPKMVKEAAIIDADSIAGETTPPKISEAAIKEREAQKQAYLEEHRHEWVFNAYQISSNYGTALAENGIHPKDVTDPIFWFIFIFILSVITSFIIFITAMLRIARAAFIWSFVNVLFIILFSLFLFMGDSPIEHFHQIKFGYYLFVLNSIALIFVSYKAKKQSVNGV
jgi:hypothetical protein